MTSVPDRTSYASRYASEPDRRHSHVHSRSPWRVAWLRWRAVKAGGQANGWRATGVWCVNSAVRRCRRINRTRTFNRSKDCEMFSGRCVFSDRIPKHKHRVFVCQFGNTYVWFRRIRSSPRRYFENLEKSTNLKIMFKTVIPV